MSSIERHRTCLSEFWKAIPPPQRPSTVNMKQVTQKLKGRTCTVYLIGNVAARASQPKLRSLIQYGRKSLNKVIHVSLVKRGNINSRGVDRIDRKFITQAVNLLHGQTHE